MPSYPWLITDDLDISDTEAKIHALMTLGTPYEETYARNATSYLEKQAAEIGADLRQNGVEVEGIEKKEIVALIAYLQRLGTDIKKQGVTSAAN